MIFYKFNSESGKNILVQAYIFELVLACLVEQYCNLTLGCTLNIIIKLKTKRMDDQNPSINDSFSYWQTCTSMKHNNEGYWD